MSGLDVHPGHTHTHTDTHTDRQRSFILETSKIPGFARESMTSYSGRYVIIQCPYVPAWSTSLFVHGVSYVYLQIKLLPTLQDQKYDMPYDVKEPRVRSSLLPISYLYSKCVSSTHYPSQPIPPLPPTSPSPSPPHTHFLPTPSPHPLPPPPRPKLKVSDTFMTLPGDHYILDPYQV